MSTEVYNGPTPTYNVNSHLNPNGSVTQLIGVADGWSDAFGRLRISNPFTLFESSFTYDAQPILFEAVQTTSGTVTHDTAARCAVLTAATTSGSVAALQSRQYLPYEKGKSQLVKLTFELGAATVNVRKRVGYFDAVNGFYFESSDAGVSFVRRSSASGSLVNTLVPQVSWNMDPLDGTGSSGVTLDITKGQILVIDGQWLGVGRVRMGFNIDGVTIYCHEWLHANRHDVAPYTQTFSLPVRWEIESTALSAGDTMKACCSEVESEGGVNTPNGHTFAGVNAANVATSTARAHLISIRPATQFPAASGLVNRSFVIPQSMDVFAAEQTVLVEVFHNSTLAGGTWTQADANSTVEVGVGQTITTPGILVSAFFVAAGSGDKKLAAAEALGIASTYPLTLSIAGDTPRALTLAVTTLANTGTARGSIGWTEIR